MMQTQQDCICEMCGKRLKSPGNSKWIFFGYVGHAFCQSDYKKVVKFALKVSKSRLLK